MKGLIVCPNCHYWGNEWETECPYCGKPLIDRCDLCSEVILSPFWDICVNCGEPLKNVQERKSGLFTDQKSKRVSNRLT